MPNFSMKEMKVGIYRVDEPITRLPDESVCQMKELFGYLFDKKENFLVVLSFANHYLHKDDAKELKALMDQQKVSVISQTDSVLVLETKKGYTITVQVIAGCGWFMNSDCRESGASESSFEDASSWNLTQELKGVERESDDESDFE